ncbi:hypothetical protein PPL_12000 [Heterostelium album PN500]|uniref:Uncharacterized protein n=1 Tax=Heterostelium pallidum (strain ATCC 26659 / Pp 5 / PN500) TaxID=670386 RepID=D3BV28_HETP5|nr:hypothetical protein PPL_12000 [Heterostelium album PN500]EFA74966.1 hypothetical protein PPL_12000 [Heterostelium album PN500]|eukprot:XP_020427100.1 hypothetical protein PPL_12000 [Heterostelium album PN500]
MAMAQDWLIQFQKSNSVWSIAPLLLQNNIVEIQYFGASTIEEIDLSSSETIDLYLRNNNNNNNNNSNSSNNNNNNRISMVLELLTILPDELLNCNHEGVGKVYSFRCGNDVATDSAVDNDVKVRAKVSEELDSL